VIQAFALAGIVALGLLLWAWWRNRVSLPKLLDPWLWFWQMRWVVGVLLAVADTLVRYHVDAGGDHYTIYGFPVMSFAFDQRGWDYVGVLMIPAMVFNALTFLVLPQLIVWVYGVWQRRITRGESA